MRQSRHPIIVLHGALGSAEQMQPVADALSMFGDVHLFELPGHGTRALGAGESFSMASFAEALRAMITQQGFDAPIVFGYSMGGYVALLLESMHPGTLSGIVTLGTKIEWTPAVAADAAARLDAAVLESKAPKFARMLEQRHAPSGGWTHMLAHTAALLTALGDDPLLDQQSLSRVTIPVHVCVGADDDTVSTDEITRTAAKLPKAIVHVLDGVPHPIERVPLDQLVDVMMTLVRDQPRG